MSAKDSFSRQWQDPKITSISATLDLHHDKSKYINLDFSSLKCNSNFLQALSKGFPNTASLRLRYLQLLASIRDKNPFVTLLLKRLIFCHKVSSFDISLILFDTRPHLKMSGICKLLNTFKMTSSGKFSSFAIFSGFSSLLFSVQRKVKKIIFFRLRKIFGLSVNKFLVG